MAKSKKSPAKKPAAKKPRSAKPARAAKKPAAKPISVKQPAKPSPKPASKSAAKPAPTPKPAPKPAGRNLSATDLKRMILERKAATKAIAFSLDEVREIAKKNEKQSESSARPAKVPANGKSPRRAAALPATADLKPHKPHLIKPASLTDILGFNPNKGRKPSLQLDEARVPEKFRRYYRLLLELRHHVLTQLGEHTEETLLKSAKDDSGDLSGYGQHMADAGTDTFDRDFALSLVSSEQEALSEIEAAIRRIHDGTYGVCEATQKPISKERLLAVPFTRYSAEAKKQVERHSHRAQQRGGLFGEAAEEEGGAKMMDDDSGGDD